MNELTPLTGPYQSQGTFLNIKKGHVLLLWMGAAESPPELGEADVGGRSSNPKQKLITWLVSPQTIFIGLDLNWIILQM